MKHIGNKYDKATCALDDLKDEIEKEIDRLNELVQAAYEEGFIDGRDPDRDKQQSWKDSYARRELSS